MASGDGENSSGFSGKRAKLVKETSFFAGATPGELENSDILQRTKQALREGFMESGTERAVAAVANEISLVRGGPFYRAQQALGLIQANQWDLGRRIGFAIAIGWVPLLVLTGVLSPEGLMSLLKDYRVHARLLIAVPALLVGELLMESRFRAVMRHIRQAGILNE